MRAFQTALRPSRLLQTVVVALHLAAAAVCVHDFDGMARIFGLVALAVSAVCAWRRAVLRDRLAVRQIAVDRFGQAAVFVGAEQIAYEADLCGTSMLSRHVLFLHWDTGRQLVRQLVLPDMLDAESLRRLYIWARWCRTERRPSESLADGLEND